MKSEKITEKIINKEKGTVIIQHRKGFSLCHINDEPTFGNIKSGSENVSIPIVFNI